MNFLIKKNNYCGDDVTLKITVADRLFKSVIVISIFDVWTTYPTNSTVKIPPSI